MQAISRISEAAGRSIASLQQQKTEQKNLKCSMEEMLYEDGMYDCNPVGYFRGGFG